VRNETDTPVTVARFQPTRKRHSSRDKDKGQDGDGDFNDEDVEPCVRVCMITVLFDIFESDCKSGRFHLGTDSGRLWAFRCHLHGSARRNNVIRA
jgi:hypothetical protein